MNESCRKEGRPERPPSSSPSISRNEIVIPLQDFEQFIQGKFGKFTKAGDDLSPSSASSSVSNSSVNLAYSNIVNFDYVAWKSSDTL